MKRIVMALVVILGAGALVGWRIGSSSSSHHAKRPVAFGGTAVVGGGPAGGPGADGATPAKPVFRPVPRLPFGASSGSEAASTAAPRPAADFRAGMNILYYARQVADPTKHVPGLLDQLSRDGVKSIAIGFPLYVDGVDGKVVHSGADTPSDSNLSYLMKQARTRGMTVMLRPLIDEANINAPDWRGTLRPTSVPDWFDSYQAVMVHYGQVSRSVGAERFVVGTELSSMEKYPDSWRQLITSVRAVFNGQVTYAANWWGYSTGFWGALDFISFDAYFPLDAARPTVTDLAAAWNPVLVQIRRDAAPFGKPVEFAEVGVASRSGAYRSPWAVDPNAPIDLDEQANYYTATCQATQGIHGLYWWNVYLTAPRDPRADGDFTPIGKPAEDQMRSCFGARS